MLTKSTTWGAPEHHQLCEQYVSGAVEILVDILEKSEEDKNFALDRKAI
nr:hypothetical protein [Anaerosporobacter sp.]